jgi:hypothetical protein
VFIQVFDTHQGIKDRELWGRPAACTAVLYCRLPPYSPFVPKAIGFVYVAKAKHHLATHQTFLGVGGWLHNVQGKYHVFSETYAPHAHHRNLWYSLSLRRVSTVRSAMELKAVFDQIQAAERDGNLSPEEKRKLEEQAAEKGLQALFKASRILFSPPPSESHSYNHCRVPSWKSNLSCGKPAIRSWRIHQLHLQRRIFAPLPFRSSGRPICRRGKRTKKERRRTNMLG